MKLRKFFSFTLLIIVLNFFVIVFANQEDYEMGYKNPMDKNDLFYCGRKTPGRLCNAYHHLELENVKNLDILIANISSKLDCICSENCLVVNKQDNFGIAFFSPLDPSQLSKYYHFKAAEYFRKNWKMGSCGNDLLLLVDVKNKKITMSMGKKADKALPISTLIDVIEEYQKILNLNNVNAVLTNLTETFLVDLSSITYVPDTSFTWSNILIGAAVFIVFICFVYCICYCRRKCKQHSQDEEDNNSHRSMKCCFNKSGIYEVKEQRIEVDGVSENNSACASISSNLEEYSDE